jgi:hypothetical protein
MQEPYWELCMWKPPETPARPPETPGNPLETPPETPSGKLAQTHGNPFEPPLETLSHSPWKP